MHPLNLRRNRPGGVINSMTHPEAWAFLNRACGGEGRPGVPRECVEAWAAKGSQRNKLLREFVEKVYIPKGSQSQNILRLECYTKIKQATAEWRKSLVGFEWHTEQGMKDDLKWSEFLVF